MIQARIVLIFLTFSGLPVFAGDIGGNGGQIVICGHPVGAEVSFQPDAGIYSLDYIQFRDVYDFEPTDSLEESFDRVEALLELLPAMQASFKEYRSQIGNSKPSGGRRIWLYSALRLVELNDQQTLRLLPPNCSHREVGDEYGAFQIIVRRSEGNLIFYEAYRPYMDKIQEAPLQASFLFVHEWLWDYATNAYQSRQANAMLHQEGIDAEEIATLFVGLNLTDAKGRVSRRKESNSALTDATNGGATTRRESNNSHGERKPGRAACVDGSLPEVGQYGMEFCKIPKGTFLMGSPASESTISKDEHQHRVTISNDFFIQTTEVTQEQWFDVMRDKAAVYYDRKYCPGEYRRIGGVRLCPNLPADSVRWDEIGLFLAKLNAKQDGFRYRLPTEAEWEYAARGGSTGPFSVAGNLAEFAWFEGNSGNRPHAVAQLKPNAYGLYDVHGNVTEWTSDRYGDYPKSHVIDPVGASSGSILVGRGGCYGQTATFLRSADRTKLDPDHYASFLGIRLVRLPTP